MLHFMTQVWITRLMLFAIQEWKIMVCHLTKMWCPNLMWSIALFRQEIPFSYASMIITNFIITKVFGFLLMLCTVFIKRFRRINTLHVTGWTSNCCKQLIMHSIWNWNHLQFTETKIRCIFYSGGERIGN